LGKGFREPPTGLVMESHVYSRTSVYGDYLQGI